VRARRPSAAAVAAKDVDDIAVVGVPAGAVSVLVVAKHRRLHQPADADVVLSVPQSLLRPQDRYSVWQQPSLAAAMVSFPLRTPPSSVPSRLPDAM